MESSLMLTQLIALYLVIGSIGILINAKRIEGWIKTAKVDMHLFISGAFALIVGLLLVLHHNIWVADWPIVITILGWGALIKGIMLMWYPETFLKMARTWKSASMLRIGGTIMLIVGALMYFSI
jgi:uncharacterized protein YjeT (DUF2065 family)